ncbi:hypothetical protein [Paraburkholderia bannensis]|uniref:hypothetical protein n=1 Tax=Paraburkholderia bannensis TaxID=765414 RepID=UPI002AB642A3|nr:hypothetical protein [Paraburkholderia bannensis]
MELYFFEEYDVPLDGWSEVDDSDSKHYVTDTAEFDSCDAHFTVRVRKGSGRSVPEATADKPFAPDFHWRIQEALQFITGKTATHRALVTCGPGFQQLDLISPRQVSPHPHFCPPIKHASINYRKHAWELFDAYLIYVVGNTSGTQWNPLAYHLLLSFTINASNVHRSASRSGNAASVANAGYRKLEDFPSSRMPRAWRHGLRGTCLHFCHLAWWPWYLRRELRDALRHLRCGRFAQRRTDDSHPPPRLAGTTAAKRMDCAQGSRATGSPISRDDAGCGRPSPLPERAGCAAGVNGDPVCATL